eukprot:CAMPEP_0201507804 /NCGR_PEP_ID=MMETSP0161_2-20130828/1361_1 /ASSEMBLY_ACC=CAM_ASM_000251 /TAXON_ID=180227 /ORGANISM="Neoparamoeba aestuarina, Strain SoJaBio B1-5/56/2" /LENGTH=220 /DNA_ID=CAMNT_0047902275 /DNA_START=61 /DNA_END=723 /DNA_ORIENTATION=+
MGSSWSSLCTLEPYSPEIAPIDPRFSLALDNDEVRVFQISNSSLTTTEVWNVSDPQQYYRVKSFFSRSHWETTDSEGRDLCHLKRKGFSFKSTLFTNEEEGIKRAFTIDKPVSIGGMYEVYCDGELVLRVRDHLSSYGVEFYQVEKDNLDSPQRSSDGSEEVAVEMPEGGEGKTGEVKDKMVAQVTSTLCSGVFLRAASHVDALLCGLVFLHIRAARNGM